MEVRLYGKYKPSIAVLRTQYGQYRDAKQFSAKVAFSELLLDGVLVYPAVGHVEAEVGPLVSRRGPAAVRDGDGVTHAEVHGLHDALALQFSSGADGHRGHVTAGADVVVALLHVLQAPPDRQPELLRDLQGPKILRNTRSQVVSTLCSQ